MSKKKQSNTKESVTLEDILFPSTLEGKKLNKLDGGIDIEMYLETQNLDFLTETINSNPSINSERELNFDEQSDLYIEKYLETKKPDFLFKAINSNPSILQE